MKKLIVLIIVSCIFSSNCKRTKEQELNDPEWRKESLEIAEGICLKLESCVYDDFFKIKKSLQNYAKSEIKSDKCREKNKKSRIYLLKGIDPQIIKPVVRECFNQIQKYSCEQIRSGIIERNNSCEEMRKIQQGGF